MDRNLLPQVNNESNNWFFKSKLLFCGLLSTKLNLIETINELLLIIQTNSRLLSKSELNLILKQLPNDYYETNSNQTIYSLKNRGKPFFIDKTVYDYNIYLHQTNIDNSIIYFNKYQDLMYVLRTLFSEQNNYCQQINVKDLEHIIKVLPKVYYEVNTNQTIYSFKLNGKQFYMNENFYNNEEYSYEININIESNNFNENIKEIDSNSKRLGQKFAEKNRLIFIKIKNYENESKIRSIEKLKSYGFRRYGMKWISNKEINPKIYLNKRRLIPQNGKYEDPIAVDPIGDKWSKSLARRRVYRKSELMIRIISSKEAKHILNKCKESLFDWNERNERRKRVELKAKLKPVVKCDLLKTKLYPISESNELNSYLNQ